MNETTQKDKSNDKTNSKEKQILKGKLAPNNKKKKLLSKKQVSSSFSKFKEDEENNAKAQGASKSDENSKKAEKQPESDKKLLKEGENDYPSLFAKVWREHHHQKAQDEKLTAKVAENVSTAPEKDCPLGWILFFELNYIFNLGERHKIEKQNLRPLPKPNHSKTLIKKSTDIIKKSRKGDNPQPIDDVSKVIQIQIKPMMVKAIILKALENIIIIMLSMCPRTFLPQIKKPPEKRKDHIIIAIPIIAGVLTILRYIIKEHAAKFVCQSGTRANQILRALLYYKLSKASFTFLKHADSSLITKLFLFEFNSIAGYIGQIPDLFSFPIIFIFSIAAMIYFISLTTLITFVIFFIAWITLIFITKKIAMQNLRKKYFSSKRAMIIAELLNKFKSVKSDSFEQFFRNNIEQLRIQEVTALQRVSDLRSAANFVMSISPLFSILIIILLENKIRHEKLGVTTTFTIVSIIAAMNKPLKKFVQILDRYYDYLEALKCVNKFLFGISEKPEDAEEDDTLKKGSLVIKNCQIEVEKDKVVKKSLASIFGEVIDVHAELQKIKNIIKFKHRLRQKLKERMELIAENGEDYDCSHKDAEIEHLRAQTLRLEEIGGVMNGLASKNTLKREKTVLDVRKDLEIQKRIVAKNLNIRVEPRQKVCLVGEDDSGINEFILSILGETNITRGSIKYSGKVVYLDADQSVFLIGQSLRDNILMGEKMIRSLYDRVLRWVGLNINSYKGKDMIEVLNNGLNFSASERRKILMARTLYNTGDIYIIRNFFGNEEDQIEEKIYNDLMNALNGKTVLIQCNTDVLMKLCDKVVMFDNGTANDIGNYNIFEELDCPDSEAQVSGLKSGKSLSREQSIIKSKIKRLITLKTIKSSRSKIFDEKQNSKELLSPKKQGKDGIMILSNLMGGMMQIQKNKIEGKVANDWDETDLYKNLFAMIMRYCCMHGKGRIALQMFLFMFSAVLFILMDIWTGCWSNNLFPLSLGIYMLIYISISFGASFYVILRDCCFSRTIMRNSNSMHSKMANSLRYLTLDFYNKFPSASIDFKLSYDIKRLDDVVNPHIHNIFDGLAFCIGGMIILNYVYIGTMLIVTIVLAIYLKFLMRKFNKTSTVFVQFIAENTSSMQDVYLTCINEINKYRLLNKMDILEKQFCITSNEMQRAVSHLGYVAKRWLGIRMIPISTTLMVVAYLIPNIIVFYMQGAFQKSLLEFALAISWSLKLVTYFTSLVSSVLQTYSEIVSFGRLEYLLENLDREETSKKRLQGVRRKDTSCAVVMKRINLTLADRLILKDINLAIKKKEKVAVVGESGSGKHVLFNLLMKIYIRDIKDPEHESYDEKTDSSKLQIMGFDIDDVNSLEIRKRITYLDKNAITFYGTVRENINPDFKYSDEQIMNVLREFDALSMFAGEKKNSNSITQQVMARKSKYIKPDLIQVIEENDKVNTDSDKENNVIFLDHILSSLLKLCCIRIYQVKISRVEKQGENWFH